MSVQEVAAAINQELTEHINKRIEVNTRQAEAAVNRATPRWSSSAEIPLDRKLLGEAFIKTRVHPARAMAKLGAVEVASYHRVTISRRMNRLQHYVLNRVRRDITESSLRSLLSTVSEMTK